MQASIWLLETLLTATLIFTIFCATDSERGQTAAHIPVCSNILRRSSPLATVCSPSGVFGMASDSWIAIFVGSGAVRDWLCGVHCAPVRRPARW